MRENSAYKTKSGLRISKSLVLLTVLLMPFFRPNGINYIAPGGQYIYDALSMASLMILFVLYMAEKKQVVDWQLILCGFMFVFIAIQTIRSSGDTMVHLRIAVTCLGLMLATALFRKRPRLMLSALLLNSEILIYINALCLIVFPKGMYLAHITYGSSNNWFMGYDNHWFVFYYGAYLLAILHILCGGSKLRSYVLIAVLHLTTLYTFSGVLVVGLLLMDVMYFFRIYRMKLFNFGTVFAGGILLTVLVVFFQTNETIQYVIANVLSKSDSMSARARIWNVAIRKILESPILGHGRYFAKDAQIMYGLPAAVNSHNMWLEILVEGGIIAFAAFVGFMLCVYVRNKDNESTFYKVLIVPISVCLIVMSVDAMIETRGVMYFAMLSIGYNCRYYEVAVDERAANEFEAGRLTLNPVSWIRKLRTAFVYDKLLR